MAGGALGALARAGLGRTLGAGSGEWPWMTFVVNTPGTLVPAWLTVVLTDRVDPRMIWRALLGAGLCGALTTVSTFQVETISLAGMAGGHS